MKENKFYINCPYEEKDLAKTLGAKWDSKVKSWYVPEGLDQNRFKRWMVQKTKDNKKPNLKIVK